MATFKPTSKATKTGGTTSKTFTPTKYAGYNQSKVYGWQAQNKSALDLLNEYYNRINAGEWLSNEDRAKYKSAIDTYTTTGNALRDVSKFYGTKYTDEEEKSWQDSLSSLNQGYTSVNDFYNQFADDKAYGVWKQGETYKSVLNQSDFDNYYNAGINTANPDNNSLWRDRYTGKGVNNMVTLAESGIVAEAFNNGDLDDPYNSLLNTTNLISSFMSDDEKKVYNYYVGKGDKAKAEEYLNWLTENELKKRQAGHISNVTNNRIGELGTAFNAGMQSGMQGIYNAVQGILNTGNLSQASSMQIATAYNKQDNTGVWGVMNDLANTTGNMVPSIAIGMLNPTAGNIAMGVSAGGNAYTELINEGYSPLQAKAYGGLVGASEALLGKWLGGITSLGGGKGLIQSTLSKVMPAVSNAALRTIGTLGKNMVSEFTEEALQTALEPALKYIATGGKAEYNAASLEEILYSGFLGALSAGALEGIPTIANGVSLNQASQRTYGAQSPEIVAQALELNPNDKLAKVAQNRLDKGKNVSGLALNELVGNIEQGYIKQDTGKIKSAVENRLTELGERGNVAKISDAIAREQAGEELSLGEKNLIKKSDFGKSVRAELNPETLKSDTEMNRWAESIGTRRLNSDVYSKRPPSVKVQTNEGKSAEIGSIKAVEGDVATVELSDGTVAKVGLGKNTQSEVKFNDAKTEEMFKIATERIGKVEGWTVESANAMVTAFEHSSNGLGVSDFTRAWSEAYNIGRNNNSRAQLNHSSYATLLDEATRSNAYNIGKAIAIAPKTITSNATYSVTFDEGIDPSTFNKKQKNDIKALEIVSKALGLNVKVFDSPVNAKGERIGKNGSYNPTTRTIEVDLHAGNHGEGIINLTSAHEVTHHMKVVARDQFNNYADAVFETLGEDGKLLIANKLEQLSRNGHLEGMTEEEAYDLAFEEVVADSSERMFVDTDALVKLSETLKKKDKTLWEKFRDGVVNILNKLKKAYAELNPQSEAAQALMNAQDKLEKIQKLWVEGVVAAAEVSDQASTEKSKTKNQDRAYLEAVEQGDMETAQKMVDEAAKKAGYDSPMLYHGTPTSFGFTVFDASKVDDKLSFFATSDKSSESSDWDKIKNQDRLSDEESFSNRSILANALASTATSDEETELLKEYQKEIAKLDANDVKIAQYKSDLKALYEKEQPNFTVIKELKGKIKKLEGQNYYHDKKLLQLESTTALKNVLKRARKDSYAKAMQKGKELMHKNVEGRYKTIERNKIKKIAHELDTLLNKGNKKRNVKIGAQGVVRAALDLSDMYFTSDDELVMNGIKTEATDKEASAMEQYKELYEKLHATDDDVTNHKEERAEIRHEMNELKKDFAELLERERKRINKAKAKDSINALATAYAKLQKSDDVFIRRAYKPEVKEHLDKLATDLGDTLAKDMTLEQLGELYDTFKMIKHLVTSSNKLFRNGKSEDIQQRIVNIFKELSEVGKENRKDLPELLGKIIDKINNLGWDNLRPVDVFELLSSEGLEELFWDAVSAQDVYANDVVEFYNELEKARIENGYKTWDISKTQTFKTADGREFKLTLGNMMSIYAYSKRPQADEHLRVGGIQFKKQAVYKDEKGITRVRSGKEYTYLIDDSLRLEIISKLTQKQKSYVDTVQNVLTEWGKKGNEVSRTLYGIDLFKEKNYFTLLSSHDYLSSSTTELGKTVTTASLVGSGFAKSTTPHANNPIILDSFDAVVLEHIDKMSKYHAYVVPIENLRKVLDAQITDSSNQMLSLKATISARFGDGATKYLEQYITDLNGGIQPGYDNGLMGLFGKAKGAQVMANLSVWAQQYFSVIRAMNEINPKYFTPFVGESFTQADMKLYEEMKKYAPITVIKEMGGFDVGSNSSVANYVGYNKAKLTKDKVAQKVQDAFGVGANVMDKLGWMTIWKAVKKEVAATKEYTLGSKEFYNACGKRMNEVITKTQVYDSVNARSGNMRKKSDWWKMATSFMGEPTTIVGMAEVALIKAKRAIANGDKSAIQSSVGKLVGTMTVLTISTAMTSIAKSLIYAMRDDDEDETYWEKYASALAGAFKDDLNLMGYLPIARDIKSIIEGYSVERPDMTLIEDFINAGKKILDKDEDESQEQTIKEWHNFAWSVANVLGIPMKNIIRDLLGLWGTVQNATNGYDMNISGAIKEGWAGKENTKSYSIYDAEMRKDSNRINYYKSTYKDEDAYYSALRKAIRENDPRVEQAAKARLDGDNDTYYNLMYDVIEEGHFDSKLIKQAFEAEYNSLKDKKKEAEAKK